VALGVDVYQQRFLPQAGEARSQIDARGGFSASTLLINNGNCPHEDLPWIAPAIANRSFDPQNLLGPVHQPVSVHRIVKAGNLSIIGQIVGGHWLLVIGH
jgi:hypothetical protein